MLSENKLENVEAPFLLHAVRGLFKKGIIPIVLYKVFLRLSPKRWMPKASDVRLNILVDDLQKSITVDLGDTIGKAVYLFGWYDKMILDFAREVVKSLKSGQPLIFVDVGANIGNHTLYLCDLFHRVVSFEPNPVAYDRLNCNILDSGLDNIEAIPIGLSDRKGRLPFAIRNKNNLGSASIVDSGEQQFMIDVDRGDILLEGKLIGDLALIKIDVEGHESNVVTGVEVVIEKHRPIIMFEYGSNSIRNNGLFIRDRLKSLGYSFFGAKYSSPWFQLLALSNSMKLYDFNFDHRCETVFAVPKNRLSSFMAVAKNFGVVSTSG